MTSRKELPGQMALEGFADAPVQPVAKRRNPVGSVVWTKYRPKQTVRCDDCVTVLEQGQGHGPATRAARWRMRTKDGLDLLLCSAHAQHRKELDRWGAPRGTT